MSTYLIPKAGHVGSLRWRFWVNSVAASPFVHTGLRKRIYRRLGLNVSPEAYDIGVGCYFHSSEIAIGNRTLINDFCYFENVGQIVIGNDVALGMQTAIVTSTHELGASSRRNAKWFVQPVTIEDGCWIGARALILGGVTVGHGTVIGAGAVVISDCEPNCVYGGVPAKCTRTLDE